MKQLGMFLGAVELLPIVARVVILVFVLMKDCIKLVLVLFVIVTILVAFRRFGHTRLAFGCLDFCWNIRIVTRVIAVEARDDSRKKLWWFGLGPSGCGQTPDDSGEEWPSTHCSGAHVSLRHIECDALQSGLQPVATHARGCLLWPTTSPCTGHFYFRRRLEASGKIDRRH